MPTITLSSRPMIGKASECCVQARKTKIRWKWVVLAWASSQFSTSQVNWSLSEQVKNLGYIISFFITPVIIYLRETRYWLTGGAFWLKTVFQVFHINEETRDGLDAEQSRQVKRTPQDSINELIIWKMNPVVVPATSVKFKSAFQHSKWAVNFFMRISLYMMRLKIFECLTTASKTFTSNSGRYLIDRLACEFTVHYACKNA